MRNYGKGGRTVIDGGKAYKKSDEYEDALDDGFDIFVIALGTNDAKDDEWEGEDDFLDAYEDLLKDIDDEVDDIRAMFIGTPRVSRGPSFLRRTERDFWAFTVRRSLRDTARRRGARAPRESIPRLGTAQRRLERSRGKR